jgi:hypothetical protein
MVSAYQPAQVWKTYLDELRNEVLLGTGVFSEDEQLRELLQECFDQGDSLNGVVSWNHSEPHWLSIPGAN